MLQLRKEKHCETTKTYYPALSAAVCMMCVCVPLQTNHTEGNSSQLFTFVKSSSSGHAITIVLCF